MKYLADTHTLLWAFNDPEKLSPRVTEILLNNTLPIYVSIVSMWEVAIKHSKGKLQFNEGVSDFIEKTSAYGVRILDIKSSHLVCLENLPFIHRDPFDRLLIATAQVENMAILTKDANIAKYDVLTIW